MELVLSIDIGTGSCRGALYNRHMENLARAAVEYSTHYPRPAWAEQDPETVYAAVVQVIQRTVHAIDDAALHIGVVILDCSVHTLLGLGSNGDPVTPVLTWEDSRARLLVEGWKGEGRGADLYALTGCPLHPIYAPAKIAWWREHQPDIFSKVKQFVTLKGFVVHRLTGCLVEDQATVSGSGLLNVEELDWEERALQTSGISREQLPRVVAPTYLVEGLLPQRAADLGLSHSTPLLVGSSDAAMSTLGSGTHRTDQMTLMIGTSGAVRRLLSRPAFDEQERTFCYYSGHGVWYAGGAINNGGIVFRWFRDHFGDRAAREARDSGRSVYDILAGYARDIPSGAEGLTFLPFLAGERAPHWNGNMRGILFGLSLRHGQGHMVRAVMEGVACRMLSVYQPLVDLVGTPEEVRATGGFSRSALWLQIVADMLGRELMVTGEPEGSVLGSAAFACRTLGLIDSYDLLADLNPVQKVVRPRPDVHERYREQFENFMRLYWKFSEEFRPPPEHHTVC
jgi:gluconokinase